MLKIGLLLLSSSSLGVLYRNTDYVYSMHPFLKWFCFFGLVSSLICFISVYVQAEWPSIRKNLSRPDMIKSPAWKLSSLS
jgi:hypothetical protein